MSKYARIYHEIEHGILGNSFQFVPGVASVCSPFCGRLQWVALKPSRLTISLRRKTMAAGIGVKGCHWNWEAHEFPTNCSARTLATYFETHHCLLGWSKLSVWRDLPVICAYMSQTVGLKKFALHGVPGGVVQEPAFFPSNFSRRPSPTCPGIQEAGKGRLSMWHFPITGDTKRQTWWAAEDDLSHRDRAIGDSLDSA